ncbi:hydrophobe/amphiphile efflux-1 family RND transporter [Sphingomonas oleivorans]|uniref:Efflux pump membrane transporter n=1 Tax=Sphingomonas oleivorans TaxID=1735121 RepID=A0A2T5FXV2_9SPHN|nr:efflux RND transporter permease subunit [Sphingomonas oleivorans]PTQ10963.1 hydrophobe/amphiphile efflux-1 family RND transporter [Sphingomonas oleivorans]
MISRIFIDRPILAWVIAIGVMLAGIGAIFSLPIAQYPDVAPPGVNISANYPGASAETLESSVTQVIEQQLTGIDGLLYFSATSSSAGSVQISVTLEKGTDPDIAQVQVQNKVQQALPRLPQQVQQQGLTVTKSNADFLMVVAVYDESDRQTNADVADYLTSNLQDPIGRIQGVGNTNVFGAQYAMRIWLDPYRLSAVGLMPSDIIAAIQAQNTQVAAGQLGAQPSPDTQMLNATVTAKSRLQRPEQFRAIIVKTQTDGSQVRLSDVARIELGSENYNALTRLNRHPAAGIAIQLAPGADALTTAQMVKDKVAQLSRSFPPGYRFAFPRDSTEFIRLSIEEVVKTLVEAIILVVIVMFVFLQNWRATLIPTIAVPVVLLGTFGVLAMFGYSINTLTLFGLVLSIGLLVDDAIVVVENVERVMQENPGLSPREATIRSMDEITGALIGIGLVLSAVFLPMAFFGGSTGVIYRQFSITIISSMALSVLVALILTPALTATLLKRHEEAGTAGQGRIGALLERFSAGFNRRFHRMVARYEQGVRRTIARRGAAMILYVVIAAGLALLFTRLPTSFLPTEDQGSAIVQYTLPPGATRPRTLETAKRIEDYFLGTEAANVDRLFTVSGFRFGGSGQNVGQGFIALKPWDEREGAENGVIAITQRANRALGGQLRDAQFFALTPPAVQGLGQSGGFQLELQNIGGLSRAEFKAARDRLLAAAAADRSLASVRPGGLEDQPTLQVDVDQAKVGALGLSQAAVDNTLSAAWGGIYVNDFIDRGRVKRVYVQGDAPYRSAPEDLDQWYVRSANGSMAPFSAFASAHWSTAPATLTRFNGIPSYQIQGQAAPGSSSGQAMDRMEQLAAEIPGVGVSWSGLSFQERLSSGQAPMLYAISLLVVFLCLAGLYESWSIPLAVLLVMPLGLIGAVLAVTFRGLENDVFFQVGLLTTMGLSAKNAILIVEFAEQAEKTGKSAYEAAIEAARLRLRPILMTSFAFIFGVLPLAISTGAGAQSRIAIGTAVIGGMLTATILAIFYVPLFFVLVRRLFREKVKQRPVSGAAAGAH